MRNYYKLLKNIVVAMLLFVTTAAYATNSVLSANGSSVADAPNEQNVDVTVRVIDAETNSPLIGAMVMVVDQPAKAAISAANGDATIKGIASTSEIEVSFVGYETAVVPVAGKTEIVVSLKAEAISVDEVVVVGYGTSRKSNLTGSVATVSEKALDSRPIQSVSQALQGQVPGVVAVQTSSQPGKQTASITIRGKNTINSGGPLVIIDGVPGDMNNIDPNDVASISILKDAASSAIYGVQAANGVILITTKRGKAGKTTVSYSGNFALTTPTVTPNYLGSYDYATLYNESQRNENPNITDSELMYSPEDLQKFQDGSSPYTHANTDWYAETFRKVTSETSHYVSISGGNEKTVYSGSYGFTYQNGNTDTHSFQRNNMRFNVENQATDWLKLGMNLSGHISDEKMGWTSPQSVMGYTNRLPPTVPIYTDETETEYASLGYPNPVAVRELEGDRLYQKIEYNTNMYAQINFLPNLSLKGVYANRGNIYHDTGFAKSYTYGVNGSNGGSGEATTPGQREGYDNNTYYTRETIQALLNYDESFGDHNVAFLAGYEQYEYNRRFSKASRKGGGNNYLTESLNTLNADNQYSEGGGEGLSRQSYFARAQYNYDNRYYFEANFRADASSRFVGDNQWGYFPALSGAWRITEEEFMKDVNWLSNLKLRLGYGQTGNEEVDGYYPGLNTYAYDEYLFGGSIYSTAKEARYVNSALQWATVTNYEAAIEAGFLNNSLSFELAVYKKITDDMLLNLPVPSILGASSPAQNAGQVQNTGFDLNVNYRKRFGEVNFSVLGNVGFLKNEITELKGTEGENPDNDKYWYIEGESVGSFYGYRAIGLFADQNDIENSALRTGNEKPGDIKYADISGPDGVPDGKITGDDREVIGSNFPDVTAGLTLAADWKNFDLQVFFQGAFGADTYMEGEAAYAFFNGAKVLERHLDRWTPDNLNASYPRITNSYQGNFSTSSYWLQDASYVRLKNLTLGYTLPSKFVSSIGLQNARVYFSGENLLTFTGMDDWDPETDSSGRGWIYGHVKKFSFGLKLTF